MAAIEITLSLPEPVARTLVKRVPARERSKFLARAIEGSLRCQESALAQACIAANRDPKSKALENDWDHVPDEVGVI